MQGFVQELIQNYIEVIKKYVVFDGRARRREFWLFVLANFVVGIVFSILGSIPGIGVVFKILSGIYSLAILLPGIAAGARRLHDTNRTALLLLLGLIPIVGGIILVVFCVQEGTPGENQYGANPKGA